jgi:hypothetical protein
MIYVELVFGPESLGANWNHRTYVGLCLLEVMNHKLLYCCIVTCRNML